MKRATRIVGFAALCSVSIFLAACPDKKQPAQILDSGAPRISNQIPGPQLPGAAPKPKMLGPVAPAIVILPANLAEPQIRVRITGELDAAPSKAVLAHYQAKYRGEVYGLKLATGKYVVINALAMDAYLPGVLAKELYASWSLETYKAQAIAARSYALFQLATGDSKSRGWDVNNDESSQMYGGIAGETAKSRAAVAETRGQILLADYKGQRGLFCAFFSACAGVASQDPNEAWGDSAVGPLRGRKLGDVDSLSDKFNWSGMVIEKADITRCVQSWGRRNDNPVLANLGPIIAVAVGKRNADTGRPTEFVLTDARRVNAPIRAEEFRLAFVHDPLGKAPKPLSSHFDIRDSGSSITLVDGHGFGHGIGMSQWGAEALARKGNAYTQILSYYYPGSILSKAW